MGGWFLEGFKECVPGSDREHMRFIDDVDFVRTEDWSCGDGVAEFTDIVYTRMRGGIDFDHIESLMVVHSNAVGTFATGFCFSKSTLSRSKGASILAVEGAGEESG